MMSTICRWLLFFVVFSPLVFGACGPQPVPQPRWDKSFNAETTGWLLSVAGASEQEVWAVGGSPDDGVVVRFDGQSWKPETIPDDVPLINWVHVLPDGTPVMACNDGMVMWRQGGEWRTRQTPTDQDLWGIWGLSLDNLWSVGGSGREGGEAVVVRNETGTWEKVDVPELERPGVRAFFKVWGTGVDNIYIVGQNGVMLHWDGAELTETGVGLSVDLISLWGTGPDDITVVGGRSNGAVAHWDGDEWTSTSLAPTPGLNGVWMDEPGEAWAVGVAGTAVNIDTETLEAELKTTPTSLELHGAWGLSGEMVWGVGGSLGRPAPFEGVMLQHPL
jgi:hypothetical protein